MCGTAASSRADEEATRRITILSLFSVAAIFLIMFRTFRHFLHFGIPADGEPAVGACRGACWPCSYIGGTVNVATLVGFITLFGIAVRNGILLVSRYRDLCGAGHAHRRKASATDRWSVWPRS